MDYIYSGNYITAMVEGLLDCAEWADTTDDGNPVTGEWTESARATARETCAGFLAGIQTLLDNPADSPLMEWSDVPDELKPSTDPIKAEYMGHNLWLSSQGHGTGFWDRGYGPAGDLFHAWAKTFNHDVYVTDSGKLDLS